MVLKAIRGEAAAATVILLLKMVATGATVAKVVAKLAEAVAKVAEAVARVAEAVEGVAVVGLDSALL